ncbi:MAG: right-handed parallel beta-helix repeat-containing protein [Dehalococcoidia bacterium]
MARLRTWKGLSILVSLALVLALGLVAVPMAGTVGAQTERHVAINCTGIPSPCYTSIQAAINASAPGDTILVHPGKYYETLFINKSLTLQSTDGWQDTTIDPAVQSIIRIEGDVDVTVQGLEITGADSYGIYISEVFSTVNILDCFIHDNISDGILVVGGGDVLNIERNIISQNGGSGIYIWQAWSTVNILDNIIGGWWGGGPAQPVYYGNNEDGIRIDDVPLESNVAIEDNFIVENGDDGIDFPSVLSVHGSVNIEDNVIGPWAYGDVRFSGNKDHGIHVAHVANTGSINIEGNAISQNGNAGINFGDGLSAIYGSITILRNIIGGWTCYPGDYGHSGDPQHYLGNYGEGIYIYQVGDSGTVTIEHNKISENAWGNDNTGIFIEHIYGEVTIADNDIGAWKDSHGELYTGNEGDGIYVYWVWPGAVLTIGPDNRIKENTDDGIEIYNAVPAGAATVIVHHNIIDNNSSNGIELGTPCEVDGATISHNIVTNHLIGIYLTGPSDQNIISDNEIRNNEDGIVVEGNDNQILRNNILNNQGGDGSGIHIVSFHGYPTSGNVIHCNNIAGNLPYGVCYEIIDDGVRTGIYNQNHDEAVDATGNWWGCVEGPGATGCDTVFGNVIYDPWLPDEFQYCEECGGTRRPPPGVPTANHWGIVAMISLFAGLLVWRVRRRQTSSLKG